MVWITGSNGMLAKELEGIFAKNGIKWIGSGRDVDVTDQIALDTFADSHDLSSSQTGYAVAEGKTAGKIDWIINCSGYTKVDKAEHEQEEAQKVNAEGPRNIARTARHIGAKLIHISTDYIFDGEASEPYNENAKKNPLSVYGRTKSAGEDAVQKEMTQYYILRASWLYGFNGHNFVYTMTKAMNERDSVKVVNDQKGTPTSCTTLASIILKIIQTSENAHHLFGKNAAIPYGIYNCSDLGETTWFGFAEYIYTFGRKYGRITKECEVNACTTADYPQDAKRPAYSVMNKSKIQSALKIKLPSWEESLEKFIKSESFAPV